MSEGKIGEATTMLDEECYERLSDEHPDEPWLPELKREEPARG